MDITQEPKFMERLSSSPWQTLAMGLLVAMALAVIVMILLMRPPLRDIADLVRTLGITSAFSLALGFVIYRKGWTRSPSLGLTLMLTYVWAAILTLSNVWIMAQAMFVSSHDLTLAGVLLIFAAVIAMTFGVFVAASVTDGLRQLSQAAHRLASGDLGTRVDARGRDEVAQVSRAFNEMAEQLELAKARREELEKLRRDLIAWTSHDLRTPLTSIRVMVEALHDDVVDDDETRQRYYRTLRSEVVALNRLIDDLFELAQLEAGGLTLVLEQHSLVDLISDTLESFRPIAERRRVKLSGQVGSDLDPVLMNAPKIGRVLSNLINNALHYTPEGGTVRLDASRTRAGVEVTVRDSGPGFADEDLPRVFEKFYRGEQARSRARGGSGLGLAIAHGIIEAHRGHIWAENVKGEGALVGFLLPGDAYETASTRQV